MLKHRKHNTSSRRRLHDEPRKKKWSQSKNLDLLNPKSLWAFLLFSSLNIHFFSSLGDVDFVRTFYYVFFGCSLLHTKKKLAMILFQLLDEQDEKNPIKSMRVDNVSWQNLLGFASSYDSRFCLNLILKSTDDDKISSSFPSLHLEKSQSFYASFPPSDGDAAVGWETRIEEKSRNYS